ncbi:hypothetical protein NDU88_004166 [Pleurodeles waltl]|uniref:Secreted protein n=1 Tax=Pleurodeles waltl TaxID=8319 RepID=A0AAV7W5U5_PLEWA|nr:hypothetical protein NDU88_004166 [Pleurodeles waltl]
MVIVFARWFGLDVWIIWIPGQVASEGTSGPGSVGKAAGAGPRTFSSYGADTERVQWSDAHRRGLLHPFHEACSRYIHW